MPDQQGFNTTSNELVVWALAHLCNGEQIIIYQPLFTSHMAASLGSGRLGETYSEQRSWNCLYKQVCCENLGIKPWPTAHLQIATQH